MAYTFALTSPQPRGSKTDIPTSWPGKDLQQILTDIGSPNHISLLKQIMSDILHTSSYFLYLRLNTSLASSKLCALQPFHSCACLARIFGLENSIEFFQRNPFGFHKEKINEDKLKQVPEDEKDIEPVPDLKTSAVTENRLPRRL